MNLHGHRGGLLRGLLPSRGLLRRTLLWALLQPLFRALLLRPRLPTLLGLLGLPRRTRFRHDLAGPLRGPLPGPLLRSSLTCPLLVRRAPRLVGTRGLVRPLRLVRTRDVAAPALVVSCAGIAVFSLAVVYAGVPAAHWPAVAVKQRLAVFAVDVLAAVSPVIHGQAV